MKRQKQGKRGCYAHASIDLNGDWKLALRGVPARGNAANVTEARSSVTDRLKAWSTWLNKTIKAEVDDPDGTFHITIHPDGRIKETEQATKKWRKRKAQK